MSSLALLDVVNNLLDAFLLGWSTVLVQRRRLEFTRSETVLVRLLVGTRHQEEENEASTGWGREWVVRVDRGE